MPRPSPAPDTEVYVPHIGWLRHEPADEVALFLNQGWFEYREQALCWLYLREGDTFLDVGAHFGLYSALAGCAGAGRVVAVEPNPAALPHLHANIVRHEPRAACVVPQPLSSCDGAAKFFPAPGGRAAYSSLFPEQETAGALTLEALTLESLCRRYALERIDLAKIDVEGAELEVLAGAGGSLGRIGCLLIECTELNLRRTGKTTESLFQALAAAGLHVCALDEERLTLVPRHYEGPIWYDNLIVTREPAAAGERLRSAAPTRVRIAREIVLRGRAASQVLRRAEDADQRAGQADQRAEQAGQRAEQADQRAEQAGQRAEQAGRRLDDALRQLEDSWKRIGEADWRAGEARAETARISDQLTALLASRFVQLGMFLGILHDPRRRS